MNRTATACSWRHRIAPVIALALLLATTAQAGDAERETRSQALLDDLFESSGQAPRGDHVFTDAFAAALTPEKLAEVTTTLRDQVGALQEREPARHGCQGNFPTVWYRLRFEHAQLDARISFDDGERIAGLYFVAAEDATPCPDPADAAAAAAAAAANNPDVDTEQSAHHREQEVEVGAEGWPVPGILTMPTGSPARAAVVLVHGSGPHDADQTIFGNKPFRDLAHGLASHGVASLRYVKRSKAHGARMQSETADLTVHHEVIEDAVAAVAFLRGQEAIPADHIYVLGHSLGAAMAPRIAHEAADSTAGLILLAAYSRPLEDLVLGQLDHLGPSQGITETQMEDFREQAARVKALARGETVDGPLLLGLPASYWADISAYDPVASAAELNLPMLILHGERDYQVTMADFEGWRSELGERDNVTLRSYPALNHLFVAGEGPSLPSEYLQPGHVDAQAINDIGYWLLARVQEQSN